MSFWDIIESLDASTAPGTMQAENLASTCSDARIATEDTSQGPPKRPCLRRANASLDLESDSSSTSVSTWTERVRGVFQSDLQARGAQARAVRVASVCSGLNTHAYGLQERPWQLQHVKSPWHVTILSCLCSQSCRLHSSGVLSTVVILASAFACRSSASRSKMCSPLTASSL